MKKSILAIALVFTCCVHAQEFKFGKVSKEELLEDKYVNDSSASAAYLYKKRTSYYQYSKGAGTKLITEIHKRIKVYNTEGFDYASETIDLYKGSSSEEKVSGIKGFTYTLEDGEVIKTKLEKEGVFKSEYSKNRNQVKFTMPNVKIGSVVEFVYKITSPYLQSIDEFVFQHSIPVKRLEAKMRILEYFKFNQRQKGFLTLIPETRTYRDANLGLEVTEVAFNLDDVPALKDEIYVSNIKNYRSGVNFEIVSFEAPGRVSQRYSKSWDDVVKTIYKSGSFGDELQKRNYFEKELDVALEGQNGLENRIRVVLDFVKKKVKWNSYRGFGTYEGTKKAYKEGRGNTADINLMLVSMLKHANITAHPVLVSTRDHGVPLFPTLDGYNYVIAAAKIGSEYCLLDATNQYSAIDVLPLRALNWYGRIVSETGNSEIMELMPKQKSVEATMMTVVINEEGSIDAKCRQQFTNHNALVFRSNFNEGSEDSYLEELEKSYGDIEISDFDLTNNLDLDKPVVQKYALYKEDAVESIGGKLFFSPMFHLSQEENPLKLKKREFPVDYGYPWEDKYIISIEIPNGYKVESLPEPKAVTLPEDMGMFIFNISSTGNKINLRVSLQANSAVIPSHYYSELKEFYRQLVEKETEKVVLSKV